MQPELPLSLPDEAQVICDIGQGLFGTSAADAHSVASCGEHFYCVTGGTLEQRRLALADAASVTSLDISAVVPGLGMRGECATAVRS